jgi:protein-S-isoprenylcysteine O-methyltransferase Ste14
MPGLRKFWALLGSAVFLVIAPGIVCGLVPWWISRWGTDSTSLGWSVRGLGIILITAGTLVLLDSFGRFALQGLGTPAPVFPTQHLVVTGLYRFVRNPMYLAVLTVILGQSMLLGNALVLGYGVLVWLGFQLFVLLYEEPTLRLAHGNEYERFCSNVPRWIPRRSPWQSHK